MGIYVITHKYMDKSPKLSEGYKWLYVGAHKQETRYENYVFDDTGENISQKNSNFCELTGLYWIRHNSTDNIKGLVHYRRFFTHNQMSEKEKNFLNQNEIGQILSEYDCIVAERLWFPYANIAEYYKKAHRESDLKVLEETITDIFPDYLDAYKKAFSEKYLFPYNMIIARTKLFDEYCDWLFKVLLEVEKRVDLSDCNQYQSRMFGFLSERLLNVWIIKNNIRYKEIAAIQIGSRWRYRLRIYFERKLKRPLLPY